MKPHKVKGKESLNDFWKKPGKHFENGGNNFEYSGGNFHHNRAEHDEEKRQALTRMIMRLFELWKLSTEEQLELLGHEPTARTTLSRYRHGTAFLNKNRDLMERVGHLLSIHKSLRLIFPHNPELVYLWPKSPNKIFSNRTPVEIIQQYGYTGLLIVRTYLDRERGK